MTQIDECTSLSIELRVHKEAVKYPAKTHARKVKSELAASDSSSSTGLIYLPGQKSEQYEDTDGYLCFRCVPSFPTFLPHIASIKHCGLGTTLRCSDQVPGALGCVVSKCLHMLQGTPLKT